MTVPSQHPRHATSPQRERALRHNPRHAAQALIALFAAMATLLCGMITSATMARAVEPAIAGVTASGAAASNAHAASASVDGDAATYWQSPADSSMQDYRRFLDFDLHGTYNVTQIDIANLAQSNAYYHYEIYLSKDGTNYSKVAYKASDVPASQAKADEHAFDATEAAYARVNVSYNSAAQQVNLAEVTFHGNKVSDTQPKPGKISVTDFASSSWGKEWNRVETDADYAEQKTLTEVKNLVKRVIGEQWVSKFDFQLRGKADGNDVFEIADAGEGRILIRGNNGVSLASGLNYYLRHWCKVDYNPLFGSQLSMPKTLPAVGKKILKYTQYEYRYALNFCTYSYTMAFWNWKNYEQFLDWAAMNGVNLMLDIVGQEEVLRETLTQYGYSDDEVREYLSGPGYYAWFYMQNMYSLGGPLPASWFEQRVELGRRIHDRMQAYGITPVIQGFGGQVPTDFQTKNPKSVAASSGTWSGFDRPYMIKTYLTDADKAAGKEDYFQKVGDSFYAAQERVFGNVSHYYAVDPFHEGGTIPDGFNIVDIYRTVQQKMLDHDADAVWVMQQWQWGIDETKLSGLADKSKALVLDLQSDLRSQAGPMESQGVPWVWNMLHNFGGRMGLDGVPEVIAQNITETYQNSRYMRGIGITPEAIDNSPVVYEMLFDMTWEQAPLDWREWTQEYAERRYGGTDKTIEKAWDILLDTAYKHTDGEYYQGASESIINARPSDNSIGSASTWGHSDIDYSKTQFEKAAALFEKAYDTYKDSAGFRYDYVDVMRQVLANSFQEYQPLAGNAYKSGDLESFRTLSSQMLAIIKAQDKLLSSSDDFLVGTWIENARTMLDDADDWTADLFELNARALITTWGLSKNGSLIDYSNRQWAGLTGDYYYHRWETYVKNRLNKLEHGTAFTDPDWFDYGWRWANRKSDEDGYGFATKADTSVDQKALGKTILDKYSVTAMGAYTDGGTAAERTNLALGRDVTDEETGASVPNMTDGNTDTGWTETGKTDASLVIDLGGTYSVTGAGITLQQIAADFPLKYEIEAYNGTDWVEIGRSESDTVSSKNEITADILASKVRFKLHSTNGKNLTGIYELVVWGAAQPQPDYTNLALGAAPSAGDSERPASNGNDGDEGTLWVGNGSQPNWYRLDLAAAQRVDRVRLVFETAGRLFQFRIVAGLADGTERTLVDETGNQGPLEQVYAASLGAETTYVKVEFTGSVGGTAWPALAELQLLQEASDTIEGTNIASTATITSSPTKDAPENAGALVDGKATAWVSRDGAAPAWFQLDYAKARDVDSIRLKFEEGQPDRSMQFTLKVTDAFGTERTVAERTEADLAKQQGITMDVPVNMTVTRIRMDIAAARIPSSGDAAWPLVSEIEVYATPENAAAGAKVTAGEGTSLGADDLKKLVDGKRDTGVTLKNADDRTLTVTLDKGTDIGTLGILAGNNGEPLRFKAEYRVVPESETDGSDVAEAADQWRTLADFTGNTQMKPELVKRFASSVFTDTVRFTVLNDVDTAINDIYLYRVDAGSTLETYLASVKTALDGLTIGEHDGDYTADAKTTLDAVIAKAHKAVETGLNSRESAQWVTKVEDALAAFYRTGYVSVDRNELYVAIDDATGVIDSLNGHGLTAPADTLTAARKTAKTTADAYRTVTQSDVDKAAQKLTAAIDKALDQLDAEERYQVVLEAARKTLNDASDTGTIGDYEGQHPQSAVDALSKAIAAAEAAHKTAAGDADAVDAAAEALRKATTTFNETVVHIDASALKSAIDAAAGLDESQYDRTVWATMSKALEAAKAVDVKRISQADLNRVAKTLADAIDALSDARLDRTTLGNAIASAQQLQEGDYTAETWEPFAKALADAVDAHAKRSTTQDELNAAAEALAKARGGLERKQPGGGETPDPNPDPDPDKPDPGENPGGGNGSGGNGGQPGGGNGSGNGSGSGSGAGVNRPTTKQDTRPSPIPGLSQTGAETLALAVAAGSLLLAGAALAATRRRRNT